MITSTHPVAPEELMAFGDGELTGPRRHFVSEHIADCQQCRTAMAEFRALSRELRTWQVEGLPGKMEEGIRAAKAETGEWFPRRIPLWAKCAVGLGFAAIAILLLGQRSEKREPSSVPEDAVVRFSSKLPISSSRLPTLHSNGSPPPLDISPYPPALGVNGPLGGRGEGAKDSIHLDGQLHGSPDRGSMVARTASLSIVVKDFAVARTVLDAILVRHRSYTAEMTVNTTEGMARTLQASLRVPVTEFAAAMNELNALGRVENENQSGEEVTQQHADLVARLKNSRETEQRLRSILQERTGKISDVLEVEQEIARVRGEIERMEAQQKSLEHRVDFAEVNLTVADVYQAQLAIPSSSIRTRLHNGMIAGLHNASETVLGMVLFALQYGLALLIWVAILGSPVLFLRRRYRRSLEAVS